jgi:integrase
MNSWSKAGTPFYSCQSAKRQRIPECLEPEELRALLSQLDRRFRVMVLLDAASGLRRSELLALKWSDVDFYELQINVRRSIYLNVIGNCKTEASRKPVPTDPMLASELWSWKQDSSYRQSDDWLFASPRTRGRNPYWPDSCWHMSFARQPCEPGSEST